MGAKEEGLPIRYVKGYSGQLRPLQTVGGKCEVCREQVWIDAPKPNGAEYRATVVRHYACAQ